MLFNNDKKFSLSDLLPSTKSKNKPFFVEDDDNIARSSKKEINNKDIMKKTNKIVNDVVNESADKVLVRRRSYVCLLSYK